MKILIKLVVFNSTSGVHSAMLSTRYFTVKNGPLLLFHQMQITLKSLLLSSHLMMMYY